MLADPTAKLAEDFEVYIEEEGLALRGSFVVDPKGKIVSYEVNANNIGREAAENFLEKHFDSIGVRSTLDVHEELTRG